VLFHTTLLEARQSGSLTAKGFNVSNQTQDVFSRKNSFSTQEVIKMNFNKKEIFGKGFTIDELLTHMKGDSQ